MKTLAELEELSRQLESEYALRKKMISDASYYADQFIESLAHSPGFKSGTINELKNLKISDEPGSFDGLLRILHKEVDAVGINSASGRHMGFIPGGGLFTSAIGDFLAASSNRYAGIAYSSPGAVEIENQVIRWLCSLVGYPVTAHGNLTSGGSIANLIAIKAARDFHGINAGIVKRSVIYVTSQVHHCILKALNITGLHEAVLREIPVNSRFQMNVQALLDQMQSDADQDLLPFLVIATAGTTDTGAIDPLNQIAAVCKQFNTWFHVDAAYGGFFLMIDELKRKFRGIEKANSVVMDPHKTLFIPYGSGVVLLRNRRELLDSNSHKAAYMNDAYDFEEIDPADTGPELSKHFRGMRIWLPLHIHGLAPFKASLSEKLLLCRYFRNEVKSMGFETGPEPELSVTIFRLPNDDDNTRNKLFLKALHKNGKVFFSSTTINNKLWIRCAVVSFRTHLEEIKEALEMIKSVAASLSRPRRCHQVHEVYNDRPLLNCIF
jgi:glutamate/tyrosine decarboxylase-like PLP-dependent enzyme